MLLTFLSAGREAVEFLCGAQEEIKVGKTMDSILKSCSMFSRNHLSASLHLIREYHIRRVHGTLVSFQSDNSVMFSTEVWVNSSKDSLY